MLGDARCDVDASQPGQLVLVASADAAEDLDRVKRVVGSHLERFGKRDGLTVVWEED